MIPRFHNGQQYHMPKGYMNIGWYTDTSNRHFITVRRYSDNAEVVFEVVQDLSILVDAEYFEEDIFEPALRRAAQNEAPTDHIPKVISRMPCGNCGFVTDHKYDNGVWKCDICGR